MKLELDNYHWINLVTRDWWGAEPVEKFIKLERPVNWIRFTYEDIRWEQKDTILALQECQQYHMKVGNYSDIPYNFLVDLDGTVYEGRGWENEAERPYLYYEVDAGIEKKCYDICFIGEYKRDEDHPPWVQLKTGWYLVMFGLKEGHISPKYRTIGFRDLRIPPYEQ